MRPNLIRTGFLVLVLARSLGAQAVPDSLVRQTLMGGLSVALPPAWRPLSDSLKARVDTLVDTLLSHSTDTLLRAGLRSGKPIILLHVTSANGADPSANLNAVAVPGAVPGYLDGQSDAQIATSLAIMCSSMPDVAARMGLRVMSCDPPLTDHVSGRTIAITRLVRTGPAGFVTVWIVTYPDRDAVFTLTLAAPQAQEEKYTALMRRIWESVEIPGQ